MARRAVVLAMVPLLVVSACSKASAPAPQASAREPAPTSALGTTQGGMGSPSAPSGATTGNLGVPSNPEPAERKIILSADLGIETGDVTDAERRAGAIAEELGGYVATSDRSSLSNDDEPMPAVNMVLRVPSDRFSVAVIRLEGLGSRVVAERVSSDDVTEETIDLTARIHAQRALEAQFVEILKQARSVKDALEVSAHLADVRTTIERLEGRQRYLENQTSISTIKLTITHGVPLVRAGRFAFGESIQRAGADFLNVSAAIVHGAIRTAGVLAPILAFVVAPFAVAVRALVRRRRRGIAL